MNFSLMTDEDILKELASRIDLERRRKELTDKELVERGGSNLSSLNRFRGEKSGISLVNFIRLLRGLGELDKLNEALAFNNQEYSPAEEVEKKTNIEHVLPQRVRKRKENKNDFRWGDEK